MSRGEHKLDRLKRESMGAAKDVPTCAVPMHAPQTTFLWERVGGVPAEQRVCSGVLKEGTTKAIFESLSMGLNLTLKPFPLSFLGFEDPPNHWTRRMVNIRLTT